MKRSAARGYLLKTFDSEVLDSALLGTARGQSTISPEMIGKLVSAFQSMPGDASPPARKARPDSIHSLSPREREILQPIARGASNKEIAHALDIAETTVKIHVQHILRTLNLGSREPAAVQAVGRPAPC